MNGKLRKIAKNKKKMKKPLNWVRWLTMEIWESTLIKDGHDSASSPDNFILLIVQWRREGYKQFDSRWLDMPVTSKAAHLHCVKLYLYQTFLFSVWQLIYLFVCCSLTFNIHLTKSPASQWKRLIDTPKLCIPNEVKKSTGVCWKGFNKCLAQKVECTFMLGFDIPTKTFWLYSSSSQCSQLCHTISTLCLFAQGLSLTGMTGGCN